MSTGPAPGYHTSEDEQILHKLGYAQELFRAMGGFQNFAISFTIISILAGCLTSYTIAFEHGGPMSVTWGWLIVGLFSTLIALADGRDRLGLPDGGRPLLLGVEARGPRLGLGDGLVQPDRPDRRHGGNRLRPRDVRRGAVHVVVQLLDPHGRLVRHELRVERLHPVPDLPARAALINVFDIRITAILNTISAYWHMAGVVFIVGVLIIVPDQHQSLSYVFTETVNNSGYGDGTTAFTSRGSGSCSASAF